MEVSSGSIPWSLPLDNLLATALSAQSNSDTAIDIAELVPSVTTLTDKALLTSSDLSPYLDYDTETDTLYFKDPGEVFSKFAGRVFSIVIQGVNQETLQEVSFDTFIVIPPLFDGLKVEDLDFVSQEEDESTDEEEVEESESLQEEESEI